MVIRPIRRDELDAFAAFSNDSDLNEGFRAYLTNMWADGYVRPEWCFVAEEAGAFIGRIVYWTLPSLGAPFIVDFLEAPWSYNYLEVGTRLLQHTLTQVHVQGTRSMEYQLDTPSRWFTFPEKRIEIVEHAGFSLSRETIRFEWKDSRDSIAPSDRLVFRTLDDVSEDAFINAIMRVSEKTLDRSIQHDQERLGPEEAASEYFKTMKALKYKPAWWQLAYTQDGALVGLVMPAENDGGPIIGFIGVIPEHRGQGYVDEMLAQGTLTLKADGAIRVRSDADIYNWPMTNAFQRAGYRQFNSRREYRLNLTI